MPKNTNLEKLQNLVDSPVYKKFQQNEDLKLAHKKTAANNIDSPPKISLPPNMHLATDYRERFDFAQSPNLTSFFTQLPLSEYKISLPYIHDVEKFCQRLALALQKKEKICIYSDYDTDAVTATAVMYWGLQDLGFSQANLSFYVPDRFTEGYGMNTDAARELSQNYDLIVSVDCGINSVLEAEIVKNSRCDLVITDHHHLHGQIPDCLAVVNPRLSANLSEFKVKINGEQLTVKNFLSESVTGVGVAWFCLVWLGYYLTENESRA